MPLEEARGAISIVLAFRSNAEEGDPLWASYSLSGTEIGALSVHGLQTMLARLGRKAGIMPCAPHRVRRTFALWMLRHGCDLHSLRMLMGHKLRLLPCSLPEAHRSLSYF